MCVIEKVPSGFDLIWNNRRYHFVLLSSAANVLARASGGADIEKYYTSDEEQS